VPRAPCRRAFCHRTEHKMDNDDSHTSPVRITTKLSSIPQWRPASRI
jgi:hypothetical protein